VGLVDRLELVDVHEHDRYRLAAPPAALQLAGEVLLERAVVAQAGERVRHGDLREPLDLGLPRVLEAAAQAQQRPRAGGEQDEPGREGERDLGERRGLHVPQLDRVVQAGGGRAVRLALDGGLEHAVDRIDDLVLLVLDRRAVSRVDGREEAVARGGVPLLQGQQVGDAAGRRRRAVEGGHPLERRGDAGPGPVVLGLDRARALEPVLALDRLLLLDPVVDVAVERREAVRRLRALGEVGRVALRDERQAREQPEHGEHRDDAGAQEETLADPLDDRHGQVARSSARPRST
jgi:hypothetical protein